jgi:hypothetical protein
MARWDELAVNVTGILRDAQSYLLERRRQTQDPAEQRRIADWSEELRKKSIRVMEIEVKYRGGEFTPAVRTQDEPLYSKLHERFAVSRRDLRQLHEWYEYPKVAAVLKTLDRHLTRFLSTGPHGTGDPPPD